MTLSDAEIKSFSEASGLSLGASRHLLQLSGWDKEVRCNLLTKIAMRQHLKRSRGSNSGAQSSAAVGSQGNVAAVASSSSSFTGLPSRHSTPPSASTTSKTSGFGSLRDFRQNEERDDNEQDFFAGGEKS